MPETFGKAIRIIDEDFSRGPDAKQILSIELLPDGFSFAILDVSSFSYQVLLAGESPEGRVGSGGVLRSLLDDPQAGDLLRRPFLKTTVSCFTSQLTLLPNELFIKGDQELLHRFSCRLPEGHTIRIDRMNNLQGFGVYSLPGSLLDTLDEAFPGHRLWNTGSALIESMLANVRMEALKVDLILHVRRGYFDLILLENNRLVFYNAFSYRIFDDLMYFLFYVLEQFEMDPKRLNTLLAGELSMDSEPYGMLSGYLGKVDFIGRNDAYRYSRGFDELPHHAHYNLLNLAFCG